MEKKKMIEEYRLAAEKFKDFFGTIPESLYDYAPAIEDAWTIRQHVIHLVDSDINNFIRIKSCIAQPHANCFVIQEEAWVTNLQNRKEDIKKYVRVFQLMREILSDFLLGLSDADFEERYFIRDYKNEMRNVLLKDAVEIYTKHVYGHIKFIERNMNDYSAK